MAAGVSRTSSPGRVEVAVAVDQQPVAGQPVRLDQLEQALADDRIDLRVDIPPAVADRRDDAAGLEHAPDLGIEAVGIEPVGGLRGEDEVAAAIGQAAFAPPAQPRSVTRSCGKASAIWAALASVARTWSK
jgi:hypothetical protein